MTPFNKGTLKHLTDDFCELLSSFRVTDPVTLGYASRKCDGPLLLSYFIESLEEAEWDCAEGTKAARLWTKLSAQPMGNEGRRSS